MQIPKLGDAFPQTHIGLWKRLPSTGAGFVTERTKPQAELDQDQLPDLKADYSQGIQTFGLLFTRWMDLNEWSHPNVVALAKASMHGLSWLHSSQIAGLRHCTLLNPGPRTFVAIERLNFYVHRYATKKLLIPGTDSSNLYAKAFAITENDKPPELGWWFEVFCGKRMPRDIDLHQRVFNDEQASTLSHKWGSLIRKLMTGKGIDVIAELDKVIRENYPAGDAARIEQLVKVIHNRSVWTPEQLTNELPALSSFTGKLGGPSTEDELISSLKA